MVDEGDGHVADPERSHHDEYEDDAPLPGLLQPGLLVFEGQEGSGSRAVVDLATPFVGVVLAGIGTRLTVP
jgi:hypothetical protein